MSLRLRLVLSVAGALLLLWALVAAWMLRDVQADLQRTLDGRLAMSARMVGGLLEQAALSPALADGRLAATLAEAGEDGIACEIRSLRGQVLARTGSGFQSAALPQGFSTRLVDGQWWRVYVHRSGGHEIRTADRLAQRQMLRKELLWAIGTPFLVAVIGALLVLWWGIGRGLRPLQQLVAQLHQRQAQDLSPLQTAGLPVDLQPLPAALNGLFARVAAAQASQRAFTDAAAHELRTPLTAVDTHLQLARLCQAGPPSAALDDAAEGVRRLAHTLDQLLALARTEASAQAGEDRCRVGAVVDSVLAGLTDAQRQRIRRIGLHDAHGTEVAVPSAMLAVALRNLLDNALHHGPADGMVTLRLDQGSDGRCCLQVDDQGPGLPVADLDRAGTPFWRGDANTGRAGAGLGLSIVRAIARRFDVRFYLQAGQDGGLAACLELPPVVGSGR